MEIQVRGKRSPIVLSPVGRLDRVSGQTLEARVSDITGHGDSVLVLDCARIDYINSAGLRALVLCAKMCQDKGGSLIVADLEPQCRKVLEVSGLLTIFEHYPTTQAALSATALPGHRQPGLRSVGRHRTAMKVEERSEGPVTVVSPVGPLDDEGARILETQVSRIVERGEVLLVLDCARMDYVNSSGLRALLLCAKACRQKAGKLAIAGLSPECRSVVDMSGFLSVIEYHETSEAAVAGFR